MYFYREKRVKKPTKKHRCEICGEEIEGEHIYRTGKSSEGFFTSREHIDCHNAVNEMCSDCDERSYCYVSVVDCFWELTEKQRESYKNPK
jgi:hypothetical protein